MQQQQKACNFLNIKAKKHIDSRATHQQQKLKQQHHQQKNITTRTFQRIHTS